MTLRLTPSGVKGEKGRGTGDVGFVTGKGTLPGIARRQNPSRHRPLSATGATEKGIPKPNVPQQTPNSRYINNTRDGIRLGEEEGRVVGKEKDRIPRAGEATMAGEAKARGMEERDRKEKEKGKAKEVFPSST